MRTDLEREMLKEQRVLPDLKKIFEERDMSDIAGMKTIAEKGGEQVMREFICWLKEGDENWQQLALTLIARIPNIKELLPDATLNAIGRQLLDQDLVSYDRSKRATALGRISKWPDQFLTEAMQQDENEVIRGEAFRSALMLAGVPYGIARGYAAQVENGQLKATPKEVEKLAKKHRN